MSLGILLKCYKNISRIILCLCLCFNKKYFLVLHKDMQKKNCVMQRATGQYVRCVNNNKKNYCLRIEALALKVRGRLTQLWNRKRGSAKSWKWFGQIEELNPSIARRIQYENRSTPNFLPIFHRVFPFSISPRWIHFR